MWTDTSETAFQGERVTTPPIADDYEPSSLILNYLQILAPVRNTPPDPLMRYIYTYPSNPDFNNALPAVTETWESPALQVKRVTVTQDSSAGCTVSRK